MRELVRREVVRVRTTWPAWTTWGALIWTAGYGALGVAWWTGAGGYPFGPVPLDRRSLSILEGLPVEVFGPATTAVALVGAVCAVIMLRGTGSRSTRRLVTAFGTATAVVAMAIVPDYTLLAVAALWPLLIGFAVFGVPGAQEGIADILYWHRVHLIVVFVGGLLWAAATLAYRRRARGACPHCGRIDGRTAHRTAVMAQCSWGRTWVWLAIAATLPYEVTRIAWVAGWPLGLSDELFRSLQDPPELLTVGLLLATLSVAGAVLTHGLVAPWGERFPRWLGPLRGRAVPAPLAVIPAAAVTVTIPPAAMMSLGPAATGGYDWVNWGTWLPGVLLVLWAVGLGMATWSYHLRRRGDCHVCGGTDVAHLSTRCGGPSRRRGWDEAAKGATMDRANDRDEVERAGDGGTIPTDTGGGGIGSVDGVSGVGTVGTDFGIAGNVPEPPGVDEEPVTIEDEDDPDAIAHRGEGGGA